MLGELTEHREQRDEHRAAAHAGRRGEHRRREHRDRAPHVRLTEREGTLALGDRARHVEASVALGHAVLVVGARRVALAARRRAFGVRPTRVPVRAPPAAVELAAAAHAAHHRARVDALRPASGTARTGRIDRTLAARRGALIGRGAPSRGAAPAAARRKRGAAAHIGGDAARRGARDVEVAHGGRGARGVHAAQNAAARRAEQQEQQPRGERVLPAPCAGAGGVAVT